MSAKRTSSHDATIEALQACRLALNKCFKVITAEREVVVRCNTILYTKDPNVGQLTSEGKKDVAPLDIALAKIATARAALKLASAS